MHRDIVFIENPPELLRKPCNIWNNNVVLADFSVFLAGSLGLLWVF